MANLTPITSPAKPASTTSLAAPIGDGFTFEEVQDRLQLKAFASWHPAEDYVDCEIRDLYAGPRAVSFMGRVANIFDSANTRRTPRSAKGCIKLCVKDGGSAITVCFLPSNIFARLTPEKVRLWYTSLIPRIQLGNAVSIWTNHSENSSHMSLPYCYISHSLQLAMERTGHFPAQALHCSRPSFRSETAAVTSWSTTTATMDGIGRHLVTAKEYPWTDS